MSAEITPEDNPEVRAYRAKQESERKKEAEVKTGIKGIPEEVLQEQEKERSEIQKKEQKQAQKSEFSGAKENREFGFSFPHLSIPEPATQPETIREVPIPSVSISGSMSPEEVKNKLRELIEGSDPELEIDNALTITPDTRYNKILYQKQMRIMRMIASILSQTSDPRGTLDDLNHEEVWVKMQTLGLDKEVLNNISELNKRELIASQKFKMPMNMKNNSAIELALEASSDF